MHKAASTHCHTENPGSTDLKMTPLLQGLRPTKKQSSIHKIIPPGWQDTPEKRGICADHTSLLSFDNYRPLYFSWTSTYPDQARLHPSRELCFMSQLNSSLPRKGREQCQQHRCMSGGVLAPFPALERALSCPQDATSEGGLIAFPCPQAISGLFKNRKTSHSLFLHPTCPCTMDTG